MIIQYTTIDLECARSIPHTHTHTYLRVTWSVGHKHPNIAHSTIRCWGAVLSIVDYDNIQNVKAGNTQENNTVIQGRWVFDYFKFDRKGKQLTGNEAKLIGWNMIANQREKIIGFLMSRYIKIEMMVIYLVGFAPLS